MVLDCMFLWQCEESQEKTISKEICRWAWSWFDTETGSSVGRGSSHSDSWTESGNSRGAGKKAQGYWTSV